MGRNLPFDTFAFSQTGRKNIYWHIHRKKGPTIDPYEARGGRLLVELCGYALLAFE
ncbi:protein of unknown function [Georgfuchsia toluolica]|uniref:Uncharacterized protein n=1 Tax=Georgfuchsia toluolica TaxID=424218 RepID=A0A916J348_9PROT|nr:protein of unknown function [Georgfuchsia toluolica]